MKIKGKHIRQIHNNFIAGLSEIEDPEFKIFISDLVIETEHIIDGFIQKENEINSDKDYQKYQARYKILMESIQKNKGGYNVESVSSELSKLEKDFEEAINRHQKKWIPYTKEWQKEIEINVEPFQKNKLHESLTIEQRIILAPFIIKQ